MARKINSTVEDNVAVSWCNNNQSIINGPLKLYETSVISDKMAKNISKKKTLKVAVCLYVEGEQFFIDSLTMNKGVFKKLKESCKCTADAELLKHRNCEYIRKTVKCEELGINVIEYTVNNTRRLSSPQYANKY